ncbi:hypothetical protein GQ55_6G120700 [Panicum hallii var. hallii]|uniref:Uncharacterized protein n=1 Tax=Panicum hallii var. hallii TaxID=1504633 RepID=A0A2T7D5V7_9POAL|nr:hypothetical protein GQ55_6G120700 [Panicum hallii var. hallii]
MGGEAGGFRARMEHYLYSGEKKHVLAGIAIFAAVFGVPWYYMAREDLVCCEQANCPGSRSRVRRAGQRQPVWGSGAGQPRPARGAAAAVAGSQRRPARGAASGVGERRWAAAAGAPGSGGRCGGAASGTGEQQRAGASGAEQRQFFLVVESR